MRTIRRLYFYALALIGLEALVWGAVNLLRTILEAGLTGSDVDSLAIGLAMVLVGLPVFLLHWLTAQRDARQDEEEHTSRIRAVFLYGAQFAFLVPVVFSSLALLNRWITAAMGLPAGGAMFAARQSNTDNLVALVITLIAFLYIRRVRQADWATPAAKVFLPETRRLYRYLWVLTGLVMTVGGVQGLISQLLWSLPHIGAAGGMLANSLSLLLVGLVVWLSSWLQVQACLTEEAERTSLLRLVVLYLVSLAGVVGLLTSAGNVLATLLAWLFGSPQTWIGFLEQSGAALSAAVPLGVLWAYHGRILESEMEAMPDEPRRQAVRRLYHSILSALGLVVTFTALMAVTTYIVEVLFAEATGTRQLTRGLAALAVGLPLWWKVWPSLQREAASRGENGDRARRSVIRRTYLYLTIFLLVVGGMGVAGSLLYNLFSHLLGSPVADLGWVAANHLTMLGVIAVFLVYHLNCLRQDGLIAQEALGEQHATFVTLVFVEEEGEFTHELTQAVQRHTPRLPLRFHLLDNALEAGVPTEDIRAAVLPGGAALNPPEGIRAWLENFEGKRLLLPQAQEGVVWLGMGRKAPRELARETAAALRQMAEGETIRAGLPGSPWAIVGLILGGFAALWILAALFGVLVSALWR
ncbi:MAG: hypothetical protein JW987_08895 [Anaerolineaceae bacterium]|nr:hypothetical protein [Anaerolineaceae bacterium]